MARIDIPPLAEAPTDEVRERMRRTGRKDTAPEIAIRRAVHARGLRYRVDVRPHSAVRSRADLVFPTERVAVYIDGCFWHGCPVHGTRPKKNSAYWDAKLLSNRERDQRVVATLEALDWAVIRLWEHVEPEQAAELVWRVVSERRRASRTTLAAPDRRV